MLQSLTSAQNKRRVSVVFEFGFFFFNLSRRKNTVRAKHRTVGKYERNAVQKLCFENNCKQLPYNIRRLSRWK